MEWAVFAHRVSPYPCDWRNQTVCPQVPPGFPQGLEHVPVHGTHFLPPWLKTTSQKRDNSNITDCLFLIFLSPLPTPCQVVFYYIWVEEGKVLALQNVFTI